MAQSSTPGFRAMASYSKGEDLKPVETVMGDMPIGGTYRLKGISLRRLMLSMSLRQPPALAR